MARLAAYYQEDFHYAPTGYGPKQRKAAYVLYEEPKNNLFKNNYQQNGSRLRALASSEPILFPTIPCSPKTAVMTLKQRSNAYGSKLTDNSLTAVQRLENLYDPPGSSPHYVNVRYLSDIYDCESVCSRNIKSVYDGPYTTISKSRTNDKVRKRLSYNDSWDSNLHSPDVYIPRAPDLYPAQKALQNRSYDPYQDDYYPMNGSFVNRVEERFHPPVSYRSDSSHGKWQQWPWSPEDSYVHPALLSPPSPLDSGLSSQSITSSPSLEAEPIAMHPGPLQIARPDRHHMCCCSKKFYPETGQLLSPPSRYDSGRSSPGAYSTTSRYNTLARKKNNVECSYNNKVPYVESEMDNGFSREQIRYGKLGLIGEPVNGDHIEVSLPKVQNGNSHKHDLVASEHAAFYHSVEENGMPFKRHGTHASRVHKPPPDYIRPCVVITEASEKSGSSSSPDLDKTPEPESSVSLAVSNSASNSSSVTSSNNELNKGDERRKTNKATEKEIRELEDMYKKCNLNDRDLLERAERRDLPTAHQTGGLAPMSPGLTRSKSDTFYEMLSPNYRNPYEKPQRAPPLRRAGVPDRIADDMALRKLSKSATTAGVNPVDNTITYMLCSSHFTPSVPVSRDILLEDNPDVEYDDLSYRQHYFGKKSKILDPQPPFGIPLRPPPPQTIFTDYLHAVPASELQPLCHPKGNPDVVRDDMAFRTLRKDEPERVYYDAAQVYKKKRG